MKNFLVIFGLSVCINCFAQPAKSVKLIQPISTIVDRYLAEVNPFEYTHGDGFLSIELIQIIGSYEYDSLYYSRTYNLQSFKFSIAATHNFPSEMEDFPSFYLRHNEHIVLIYTGFEYLIPHQITDVKKMKKAIRKTYKNKDRRVSTAVESWIVEYSNKEFIVEKIY